MNHIPFYASAFIGTLVAFGLTALFSPILPFLAAAAFLCIYFMSRDSYEKYAPWNDEQDELPSKPHQD
tara:strand:+ start:329 stop:532 length:204 start_codon:yes stop_codon:yes gene_type:complete